MTEAQTRLLRVIAERVDRDQVVEVHLFPAIRQGGAETGVAVVAVQQRLDGSDALFRPPVVHGDEAAEGEPVVPGDGTDDLPTGDARPGEPVAVRPPHVGDRLTIYSATYRLTIKGPDRGKWEADVVPEADAPIETVDLVVRGVQRRAGELAEPERFSGDAYRAALDAPSWTLAR
jgi:hypothetical protein